MFVVQAHSFTQQARLAITLAWVAGYTNILTFLTCSHASSHVTGTASNLGQEIANSLGASREPGAPGNAAFALFILFAFLLGAVVSGLTTEFGRRKNWESVYVLPMGIEASLLALLALAVELHDERSIERGVWLYVMIGLASLAMGLQNATITRISSGVVRTTHVTGVLTDLGLELSQFLVRLRSRRFAEMRSWRAEIAGQFEHDTNLSRLVLLTSIFGSFLLGAGLGTAAFALVPTWSMFPPVVFLAWVIYQDVVKPIAEIEPSDLVSPDLRLEEGLAVYQLRRDERRRGKTHRMPNLLTWGERLPADTRVIILDLAHVTQLDANSALELRALITRMQAQNRDLVISGIDHVQFDQLRRAGAGDVLDPFHVSPDLELAIARGMNLLEQGRNRMSHDE